MISGRIILYVISAIVVLYVLIKGFIRTTSPFWSTQPAFHKHNIGYWIYPIGIIHNTITPSKKYIDVQNIQCFSHSTLSDNIKNTFHTFIKTHNTKSKDFLYKPEPKHIVSYLHESIHPAYVCVHKNPYVYSDYLAVISARPVDISIHNKPPLVTYYMDHLCVKPSYRKKGYAPKIIQTLCYNILRDHKTCKTCIFKLVNTSTSVVPLISYKQYEYTLQSIQYLHKTLPTASPICRVRKITTDRSMDIWHMLKKHGSTMNICIKPHYGTLFELIKTFS